jgi:D-alanine-D-alanine ligase
LQKAGVNAHAFDPAEQSLTELKDQAFDRVFNALHGKIGEDGVLQGSLTMMKIPFTGSSMLASAIGMDKVRSKLIWQALQLDVIPGYVVQEGEQFTEQQAEAVFAQYGPQLMVKPASEGSSIGMSICTSADDLQTAVEVAKEYSDRVVIETWLSGPEYTVAIIGNRCLPAIRIVPHRDFYDFEAKYQADSGTEYFCPCGLSEAQEAQLQILALKAFMAVGCSGWGRVDFMYDDKTERMYLLELNTVPGMTETSLVPKAAAADGMSFEDLCLAILDTSMAD